MNEEYKLQDEEPEHLENYNEYPGEITPTEENISGPVKASKFRRLLIPIGIIVAIIIVYNILNWFSAKRSQTEVKQETEIAQKQEATEQIPEQPATTTTAAVAPQPMVQQSSISQEDIASINKNNEAIKDQLTNLNQKLEMSQSEILNLSGKMDQLASAVVTIQDELQKAKEEAENKKKLKAVKPKSVIVPIYHVRAIVPDRAWLESSEGKTVTVRVGNKLEGYGTVELISPKQGMVVTSSGTIIQYGVNDF